MPTDYRADGVNLEQGDAVSKLLYEAAKQTWTQRQGTLGEVIVPFEDFSGLRALSLDHVPPGTCLGLGFDGIGTKVEIAERLGDHRTMAFDLFAMVADDAVIRGAEPIAIGTILDVNALAADAGGQLTAMKQLAEGYVAAARDANVVIINGELAELGDRIGGYGQFNYNWGAGVLWLAQRERLITGKKVQSGDSIVALEETGWRSNGLSLARKVLQAAHGDIWHTVEYQGKKIGEWLLQPSRIYTRGIVALLGGVLEQPRAVAHGLAHITGGGIPSKLGRALKPSGYGAQLDNLYEPGVVMRYCQELGKITDEAAYRAWNMGQGMLIITPEPEVVVPVLQEYALPAKVVGRITEQPGIQLTSRGHFSAGAVLQF